MTTVLFACVRNAGRSQMAAALFNALADPAKARAVSAGTSPAECVQHEVVQVMRELGVDLADATPTRLTDHVAREADLLITMGCGEACPVVPGARYAAWDVPDPYGQPGERVRAIREEIHERVRQLVDAEHWARDEDTWRGVPAPLGAGKAK